MNDIKVKNISMPRAKISHYSYKSSPDFNVMIIMIVEDNQKCLIINAFDTLSLIKFMAGIQTLKSVVDLRGLWGTVDVECVYFYSLLCRSA